VNEGPFEIERRYLVRVEPDLWGTLGAGVALRQGYVSTGSTSVRIRVGETRGAVLTCKSGRGVRRREVEEGVSPEMAQALLQAAGERVLEKVRYRLGPWELDRFHGDLEGLTLLEIELDHENDPVPEPPGGIEIMAEVTDNKLFTNSSLASLNNDQRRAFVGQAYQEGGE